MAVHFHCLVIQASFDKCVGEVKKQLMSIKADGFVRFIVVELSKTSFKKPVRLLFTVLTSFHQLK